jgi:cytochrome oxidase Cu insertion factor (SCO1/SenC/PrrC family)/thiol-disulfide isomerase/thioredoxin
MAVVVAYAEGMLTRIRWILTSAAIAMAVVAIVVSLLGGRSTQSAGTVAQLPAPLAAGDAVSRAVPPLRLIDERGRALSIKALRGRWVIFAPVMTLCHEVCPMTTGALMDLRSRVRAAGLGLQVLIAQVSVDPWRDTPRRLRAYQRLVESHLPIFTGTRSQLRRFWRFFGVYFRRVSQRAPADVDWLTHKPETMDVEHSDGLFFLDPGGQERIAVIGQADVKGRLSVTLRSLLNDEGRRNLAHPQSPWNASQALDDLYWLMGKEVPVSSLEKVKPPSASAAQRQLADSPAALAQLHAQAAQLLGSLGALKERLKALHGYPVVLNAWASWCPPCRQEFPLFAVAAAAYGRRVGFLGVATDDDTAAARAYLHNHTVSYPSYQASSESLSSIATIQGVPTTIFLDGDGHLRYTHVGQYETQNTLDQDIERFALRG